MKIRRRLQKKADTTTMTALLDAKATRGERGADPGTAADLARLQSELGGCRNSTEELAAQLRGCAAHPSGPCIHRAQQQWRSRLPTGGEVRVRQRHTNHTGARPRCLAAAVEQKVASRRRQTQRRASTMEKIRGKSVAARPATWAGAAESANAESGGDEEPVRAYGGRKATTARRSGRTEERGRPGADCIVPCLHERTNEVGMARTQVGKAAARQRGMGGCGRRASVHVSSGKGRSSSD